jgi:uncharacterized protein YqgV (UPF0045/DUF77 family)
MLVEIQVLPTPSGTIDDRYRHVDAAIARIAASGARFEVGALGTTIEGDADELWPLLRAVHDATIAAGASEVITVIKIAEHRHAASDPTIDGLTAPHRGDQ